MKAYFGRGVCYRKIGKFDESITDLKQACEKDPNQYKPHTHLGRSYFDKGDYDEALNEFTKAINLKPKKAFNYNNRGLVFFHT